MSFCSQRFRPNNQHPRCIGFRMPSHPVTTLTRCDVNGEQLGLLRWTESNIIIPSNRIKRSISVSELCTRSSENFRLVAIFRFPQASECSHILWRNSMQKLWRQVVCAPKDEDGGKHIVHQNNRLLAPAVSTRSKTAK